LDILDLFRSYGFEPKYKGSTKGGEYGSPCPFCGGKDRLIIHPNQGDGGRWWCRQCGRSGDCIQFLRDYREMTFREAAEYVGKEISSFTPSLTGRKATRSQWVPRETTAPADPWQVRARRLVEESENWLFQPSTFGQKMLGWLKECRGLSEETIRANRLGLVPVDRFEGHEQWGVQAALRDDGTPKKIWIPLGLTIPFCKDGEIYRIRIRRPKFALRSERDPRYYLLRGSDTRALVLGQDRDVFVVVESELDAILLFQEAGDLVGVIALGNAQARPDKEAMAALSNCKLILVALDGDKAGAKEAWNWWLHHFSHARRWPPIAKDPGEMFQQGVNLRTWIEAGIDHYQAEIAEPENEKDEPVSSKDGHGTESQTQAQPSLDEATRSQEYQAKTSAPGPLSGVAKEKIISPIFEANVTPEPATMEEVDYKAKESEGAESARTCYKCRHFRPDISSPDLTQALGRCCLQEKDRYGGEIVCEGFQGFRPYKKAQEHELECSPK
jgi:DNA primase